MLNFTLRPLSPADRPTFIRQLQHAFQAALLHRALSQSDLSQITDDASAVEQLGLQPLLVTGDSRNIKLTRPDDAALAEYFLQQAA